MVTPLPALSDDDEAAFIKSMKDINTARKAIIASIDNKRSVAGQIACPVCTSGTLYFTRAYNGHVHAGCTTEGCVRWME